MNECWLIECNLFVHFLVSCSLFKVIEMEKGVNLWSISIRLTQVTLLYVQFICLKFVLQYFF